MYKYSIDDGNRDELQSAECKLRSLLKLQLYYKNNCTNFLLKLRAYQVFACCSLMGLVWAILCFVSKFPEQDSSSPEDVEKKDRVNKRIVVSIIIQKIMERRNSKLKEIGFLITEETNRNNIPSSTSSKAELEIFSTLSGQSIKPWTKSSFSLCFLFVTEK